MFLRGGLEGPEGLLSRRYACRDLGCDDAEVAASLQRKHRVTGVTLHFLSVRANPGLTPLSALGTSHSFFQVFLLSVPACEGSGLAGRW